MDFPSGSRLGRYIIRSRLGEGGLADVYRALDPASGQDVALKVLDAVRRAENPGLLDRMHREAAILQALQHVPAVVGFVEMFEDPDTRTHVLTLELVDGRSLATFLGDASLPVRTILEWMGHACHALHDMHSAGWVHRDIKPDNLLVTEDPDRPLRLIDFNSAGSTAQTAGNLTRMQGVFPHTPAYLAPECFDGVPPDASADVYALAMTFAELLIGRHPLLTGPDPEHTTNTAWLRAHTDTAFPDLRALRPDVPEGLQEVFVRATAKARADRYPDAVALWAALKGVWDRLDAPDGARSPEVHARDPIVAPVAAGVPSPPGPSRGAGPLVVAVVLGLGALLVVGLGVGGTMYARFAAERDAAAAAAAEAERKADEEARAAKAEADRLATEEAARRAAEAEAERLQQEATARAQARAAAIGAGIEAVPPVVSDPVTLDKLRNARRIDDFFIGGLDWSTLGTAEVEEVAGVLFFSARQQTSGGRMSIDGVVTEVDARGFTLQAHLESDEDDEPPCRLNGRIRFGLSSHPWYFRYKLACNGTHDIDLFVDDAWLDAHPEHKPG